MTPERAMECLRPALTTDGEGRFQFACKKALVVVRVRGRAQPLVFHRSDKIAFRISAEALIVEPLRNSGVPQFLAWESVECLTAGEPETDCRDLFQG